MPGPCAGRANIQNRGQNKKIFVLGNTPTPPNTVAPAPTLQPCRRISWIAAAWEVRSPCKLRERAAGCRAFRRPALPSGGEARAHPAETTAARAPQSCHQAAAARLGGLVAALDRQASGS